MASSYFPPEMEGVVSKKELKKMRISPREGKRVWDSGRARSENSITWRHQIGSVMISAGGFGLGKTESAGGYYWAEVKLGDRRPSELVVNFAHNLDKGIIPFFCHAGVVTDCGYQTIPALRVPIEWTKQRDNWIPHTRQKDRDNADLVLRNDDGQFIDLQVAIVSRAGRFYLSIQEISSGQIMRLPAGVTENVGYRDTVIDGRRFIVVPLLEEHAYAGADFMSSILPRSGPDLLKMAAEDEAFVDVIDCIEAPEWGELDFPVEAGWVGAVVLWFNPLVGARVVLPDGVDAFVPLAVIPLQGTENDPVPRMAMAGGDYPLVLPAQKVLIQLGESKPGKGHLVRAIKPIWK